MSQGQVSQKVRLAADGSNPNTAVSKEMKVPTQQANLNPKQNPTNLQQKEQASMESDKNVKQVSNLVQSTLPVNQQPQQNLQQ